MRELFWVLGFLVAWILIAVVLVTVAARLVRPGGGSTANRFHGVLIVVGAVLAVAAVRWVDCALFVSRPGSDPACGFFGF